MPRIPALYLLLAGMLTAPGSAAAQEKPSDSVIIGIAQKFVLEHFKTGSGATADVAFDIANIHPQTDKTFWAVVGGFMEKESGAAGTPHAYGLTMRLTCAHHDELKCWKLEKLLIDQKLIVDQ